MGSYTLLEFGSIRFQWKYHIPPFAALLFEESDFIYETNPQEGSLDEDGNETEVGPVGYRSTAHACKTRLDEHGYTLPFITDIYSLFREELSGVWDDRIAQWFPMAEDAEDTEEHKRAATVVIQRHEPATAAQELGEYVSWLKEFMNSSTHKNFIRGMYTNWNSYYEWLCNYIDDNILRLHPSVTTVGSLLEEDYLFNYPEIVELIHCRLLLEALPDDTPVTLDTADILGSYMSMDRDSCEAEMRRLLLQLPIDLLTKASRYDRFVRMLRDKEASWRGRFSKLQVRTRLREVRAARTNDEKGKALEGLMELLFHVPPELVVTEKRYKTGDEEIDLLVKNNVPGTFWAALGSPLLFVECKNWKGKAGSAEARDFAGKVRHHSSLVRIGFFVSMNGFTKEFDETLKRESALGGSIVKISAEDIGRYAEGMLDVGEWLENLITKIV